MGSWNVAQKEMQQGLHTPKRPIKPRMGLENDEIVWFSCMLACKLCIELVHIWTKLIQSVPLNLTNAQLIGLGKRFLYRLVSKRNRRNIFKHKKKLFGLRNSIDLGLLSMTRWHASFLLLFTAFYISSNWLIPTCQVPNNRISRILSPIFFFFWFE